MNGVFAVRKPSGPTSQDVVAKLKHIFTRSSVYARDAAAAQGGGGNNNRRRGRKQKFIKIGHGGTLDPLADGTLVIGVGTGTKQLASYLGQCSKVYTARALLGASTTTYDSEGAVLEYGSVDPASVAPEKLDEVLARFRGQIKQLPPVFSALKMDGKPLYEYAREGIALPRAIEPRECEVSRLEAAPFVADAAAKLPENMASPQEREFAEQVTGQKIASDSQPAGAGAGAFLDLTFSVSSGTYIRTLIHDIGEALGTKAHMVKLTRDSQGEWELGKNVLPLELFQKDEGEWWPPLHTVLEEGPKRRVEISTEAVSENKEEATKEEAKEEEAKEEEAKEEEAKEEEATKEEATKV